MSKCHSNKFNVVIILSILQKHVWHTLKKCFACLHIVCGKGSKLTTAYTEPLSITACPIKNGSSRANNQSHNLESSVNLLCIRLWTVRESKCTHPLSHKYLQIINSHHNDQSTTTKSIRSDRVNLVAKSHFALWPPCCLRGLQPSLQFQIAL